MDPAAWEVRTQEELLEECSHQQRDSPLRKRTIAKQGGCRQARENDGFWKWDFPGGM